MAFCAQEKWVRQIFVDKFCAQDRYLWTKMGRQTIEWPDRLMFFTFLPSSCLFVFESLISLTFIELQKRRKDCEAFISYSIEKYHIVLMHIVLQKMCRFPIFLVRKRNGFGLRVISTSYPLPYPELEAELSR